MMKRKWVLLVAVLTVIIAAKEVYANSSLNDFSKSINLMVKVAKESKDSQEELKLIEFTEATEEEEYTVVTVRATAYCHCSKCCGSSGNPTASGVMPKALHTLATGSEYEFGTKIKIPYFEEESNEGYFTVEDRGVKNGQIDIFMDSHQEALNFGVMYLEIYVYDD